MGLEPQQLQVTLPLSGHMNDDFRFIAAIAEYGSISAAARAEHVSQPAISQRLRRLEARLGTELFDRTTQPLCPTDSGEIVIRYARRALAAEVSMRREVNDALNQRRKQLSIGISTQRANALLADPITEYYEQYHDCPIVLRPLASFEQLHGYFLNGEIDCALFTPIMPDPDAFELEVLCREQLVVIAATSLEAPQLKRAKSNRISIGQLEGIPFVLPTCGAYFDPIISHLIDDSHVQLDIVARDCEAELALSLVGNGLGISIVPSTLIVGKSYLRSIELADVKAGNVLRYIRKRGAERSREEERFVGIVKKWLADNAL